MKSSFNEAVLRSLIMVSNACMVSINQSIIYFNTLRQRAKKTRSKYERV